MRQLFRLILVVAILLPGVALAVNPDEILKDPALEARARHLSQELRCMVCQNQSIDDSEAPLAKDLRLLIREHLVNGESDRQIMDYVVARYGEFVLLRPRLTSHTVLLWATPFVVLVLAGIALFRRRRSASLAPEQPLTDSEKQALSKALE